MSANTDSLTDQALALPVESRLILVDQLLSSLNPSPDAAIEAAWRDEAEARLDRLDRGETEAVDGESVFQQIREKYAR